MIMEWRHLAAEGREGITGAAGHYKGAAGCRHSIIGSGARPTRPRPG